MTEIETETPKPKRPATAREIAELEFEPLTDDHLAEIIPPSKDEWDSIGNTHLVAWRMAWVSLRKTKPELVDMLRKIGGDEQVSDAYLGGIERAISFFDAALGLLKSADARILCAGAVLEIEEDEQKA